MPTSAKGVAATLHPDHHTSIDRPTEADIARRPMTLIRGGSFLMGSDRHYPEEKPRRAVSVDDFWIDKTSVCNRDFAEFVKATGYMTAAERQPDPAEFPDAPEHLLVPGSAVFTMPIGEFDPGRPTWWSYMPGASWRTPQGPETTVFDREDHPVVHVTYEDALAYCAWAEVSLPTEAEWEYAARGGLTEATYAWGDELTPLGRSMANIWSGKFPAENLKSKPPGTEAAESYPPNGYGLHDMIGNVWEWTTSPWSTGAARPDCCRSVVGTISDRVLKGGSYLCSWNYCRRFRPAARTAQPPDSPTSHIGFRCVRRIPLSPAPPSNQG